MLPRYILRAVVAGICLITLANGRSQPSRTSFAPPATIVLPPGALPSAEQFARLAETNPLAMLEASLKRYRQEVQGYRATLLKQERIGSTLHPEETIRVAFRESPFSVLMLWQQGARRAGFGTVQGSLFVLGENDGKMIVWRPDALLKETRVNPRDSSARDAARFSIEEFGIAHGAQRTYRAWKAAGDKLVTRSLGQQKIPELGDRLCYVIERILAQEELDPFVMGESSPPAANRADAFRNVRIMIDAETWLQTGAILTNTHGEKVASYFFRDVELNPQFEKTQFTPAAFRK